jgi:hypothetical protein
VVGWRAGIAFAALVLIAVLAYAALTGQLALSTRAVPILPERHESTLDAPKGMEFGTYADEEPMAAASPDGSMVVFRTGGRTSPRWWVKHRTSPNPVPLDAPVNAAAVFWAPDSRQVIWCAASKGKTELWTAPLSGGTRSIATGCATSRGISWGANGDVLFVGEDGESLRRVAAAGGPSSLVSEPDRSRGEVRHGYPAFLPMAFTTSFSSAVKIRTSAVFTSPQSGLRAAHALRLTAPGRSLRLARMVEQICYSSSG